MLRAFELPPTSPNAGEPTRFVAAGGGPRWSGAALYLERAGELVPIGHAGRRQATIATLATPLAGSPGLSFETAAALDVVLESSAAEFAPASQSALLQGANRLLVGGEVLQFADAQPLSGNRWRLRGLLRGRGGTEPAALAGHPAGTSAVLLDGSLVALDPALVPVDGSVTIAAIGLGDANPVFAALANPGLGQQPPCPVHPSARISSDGGLTLAWVRRARGAWTWADGVDAPMVEDSEQYRVGLGPVDAPVAQWPVSDASLSLDHATVEGLALANPGAPLWVRQVGRFALSEPLLLTRLP